MTEDDFELNLSFDIGSTNTSTAPRKSKQKVNNNNQQKKQTKAPTGGLDRSSTKKQPLKNNNRENSKTTSNQTKQFPPNPNLKTSPRNKSSQIQSSVPSPPVSTSSPSSSLTSRKEKSDNSLTKTSRSPSNPQRTSRSSEEEDPHQFHAKPRDLSRNALSRPQAKSNSTRIFTETPFSSLALDPRLITHLEKSRDAGGLGLTTTTKIQNVVIPSTLENRQNILMKSETGSGKTLAYLIPIMNDLMCQPSGPINRSQGTYAVILTPTRELCSQIYDILELLTKCNISIVSGCLIGGEKRKSEKARLRKGVSIVVGTPGRFLDHIKTTESFNLNTLRWFVLDEADRLLDMGFGQTILEICTILTGQVLTSSNSNISSSNSNSSAANSNLKGDVKSEARTNLQNKWHQHSLQVSKLCNNVDNLCYLMASATITTAVKQLAMPLMSGRGFLVIDGEHERIDTVTNINDLLQIGKDKGRLDGLNQSSDNNSTDLSSSHQEQKTTASSVGSTLERDEKMAAPEQLSQYFMMTTCKWKLSALISFIQLHKHEKLMIFFSTCDGVDYHALLMNSTEWPQALDKQTVNDKSDSNTLRLPVIHSLEPLDYTFTGIFGADCPMYRLHGNVPQRIRQQVYKSFCKAEKGVLFCTDVAARGLDLPKVDWIVQYDPPCETTDYIHRIGRTARRGLGGSAVIFLLPSEAPYIQLLESHGMIPLPLSLQGLFLDASKDIPGSKKFQNIDEMMAVIIQRRVENTIAQNSILADAAKQAFCSFIRAYATHSSDAKGIFKVQSLHLGHVAKSFGLRESPSVLRCKEDTIGKVFNGVYRAELVESEKKKRRDEKYSLSGVAKRKDGKQSSSEKQMKQKKRSRDSSVDENEERKKRNKQDRDRREVGGGGGSGGGGGAVVVSVEGSKPIRTTPNKNEKQKLRHIGSGPSPSGSFRKSNGYFRKKLRTESKSEFSR